MGIYIPKQFPKNCNDCPCTSGWNCFADNEMRDIAEYDDNHTKPDWCPLVEVPPHGRLIDTDSTVEVELYDDEHEEWKTKIMSVETYLGYCYNEVPTIIEGDGKE